jgi:hypothetical protein
VPSSAPEAAVTAPSAHPSDESSPVYTRWWFWTLVGVAVGTAAASPLRRGPSPRRATRSAWTDLAASDARSARRGGRPVSPARVHGGGAIGRARRSRRRHPYRRRGVARSRLRDRPAGHGCTGRKVRDRCPLASASTCPKTRTERSTWSHAPSGKTALSARPRVRRAWCRPVSLWVRSASR